MIDDLRINSNYFTKQHRRFHFCDETPFRFVSCHGGNYNYLVGCDGV
jgi:hypothetical protein